MTAPITHRRPAAGRLALLACLLALAGIAATAPASASAKSEATPCWKKLINDWYDGRIDHSYPAHCYDDALKHLPDDVRAYSDAYDVISRALASATRGQKDKANVVIPPPANGGSGGSGGSGGGPSSGSGGGGSAGSGSGSNAGSGTTKSGDPGQTTTASSGFFTDATDKLGSDSADTVPVPLLVLAGLALLLVAAGAAGLLARRLQARRPRP